MEDDSRLTRAQIHRHRPVLIDPLRTRDGIPLALGGAPFAKVEKVRGWTGPWENHFEIFVTVV